MSEPRVVLPPDGARRPSLSPSEQPADGPGGKDCEQRLSHRISSCWGITGGAGAPWFANAEGRTFSMRPWFRTLPLYLLEFDVHWSARAARHICRTTDRILNLLRRGGGAGVDRWSLRRERRSASLSARHLDAHRRENVGSQERYELVDEAQLRLDLGRAVRALRSRMDRARWHEPENPPSRKGLLDDLVRGSQPGFNGGVITRKRCDEEAGDGEPQNPGHLAHPPGN